MYKLSLVLILAIVSINIYAQPEYKLNGMVLEEHDSSPLIGVNVLITELKLGTSTDEEGKFLFENITAGDYTLKFSFIGHETIFLKVNVPMSEPVSVSLRETAIDLGEITVTGNPLEINPKNISQATILLSKLDLQISRSSTLSEALNFQPGISIRSNGTATSYPVIRGFTNNRVLILEDGLRVGDLSNASDDHSLSGDGSTPEKIEVLRGPASLLYGSNAIGGVVNILTDIIPPTVPQKPNGEIYLEGSSVNNEYLGSLHLNAGVEKFSFHGNYFKRKAEDYDSPEGTVQNSSFENEGYQFGASVHPEWGIAGLSFTDFSTQYGIPVNSLEDDPEEIFLDMNKKQYRILTEYESENDFVRSLSLKAAYQDYEHKEILKETGEIGTNFALNSFSADLSVKHKTLFGKLNGVVGVWGLKQDYTVDGEEAFTPDADYASFAVYILEQIDLNDLHFQFGARYELNDVKIPETVLSDSLLPDLSKTFNTFSGSIGMVYNFDENISGFANLANAFRAPTVEELSSFAIHEATGSFDIGDRNLDIEKSLGFDLGLRVLKGHHTVELSFYYNSLSDFIFRQNTGMFYSEENQAGNRFNDSTGIPVYNYVQADAILYGMEAKARYEFFRGFSTTVIFDYVRGKNKSADENLPQIPPARISFEPRYATDYFYTGLRFKFVGDQNKTAPGESSTSGFALLDIYSGVKFITGTLAHLIDFKIENLFNRSYRDHLSAIKEFAYMPGRNFQLSYKFIF